MAPGIDRETCTLIVNNIPKNVTSAEIESVFEDIGPLKKCYVVSNKNDAEGEKRVAYVTFAVREDVESALETPITVGGTKLNVKVCEKRVKKTAVDIGTTSKDIKEKRQSKKNWQRKKPRLIVRNLSFQVSEDDLKKECSVFGELTEVSIPTNSDGRKRGFAFIQFKETKSAIKAIKSLNLKRIKGRPIAIDFALPKNKYDEKSRTNSNQKEEDNQNDSDDEEGEEGSGSDDDASDDDDTKEIEADKTKVKADKEGESDRSDDDDTTPHSKDDIIKDGDSRWFDTSSDDESRSDRDEDDENMDEKARNHDETDEDSEDDSRSESECAEKRVDKSRQSKAKSRPNDGRTLFVRNIPFMADEESFRECAEQFGEVSYALLCLDPQTDHPKGTGFVRFKEIESAKKFLETADEESEVGLVLEGRRIYASEALSRDDIERKAKTKSQEKESKDKRNLYLAREGLIREGSLAAKDVSKADMAKRIQLEVKKKQMLRNLHFFVSRTRLVIHNLPPNIDDKELRQLCHHAANANNCKITEAKVMKNLKQVNSEGKSPSKGFGFVTFTEHEHALAALRHLNNNPDVFSAKKRPIVEFSIENKKVLNAKTRKRDQNMKRPANSAGNVSGGANKEPPVKKSRKNDSRLSKNEDNLDNETKENYTGFISKKDVKTLPTHIGPKIRNRKNKRKVDKLNNGEKRDGKSIIRRNNEESSETKKKSKRKRNKNSSKNEKFDLQDEKSFQNLVSKYRKTVVEGERQSKGKWFQQDS